MNTVTDYIDFNFNERSRFVKNKSKTRFHEKRKQDEREISKYSNMKNKRIQQTIKNFKRNNDVERNPVIVNLRGDFDSIEDYEAWRDHMAGPQDAVEWWMESSEPFSPYYLYDYPDGYFEEEL